ncbi:universal stress protein [Streptomyces sp. V4-01]|uniref:Universal stress protein n=1 Tax=Actinacidiphila polyblastidii TaxID=3110430 RepID=A0ABU7PFC8_9ACTN|nr:universal stress protein [Streptomyces sp. V4-01]
MMTHPVVAAVDGSPESLAAAAWAGAEAQLRAAPLRLLTVWQPPMSSARFTSSHERLRSWEENRMREAADALAARRPGLDVTIEQAAGTPIRLLLDAGAGAEMIVLGSRGLGGTAGFFYGSVGLHLLASCERPVVLVRATDTTGCTVDRGGADGAGAAGGRPAPCVVLGLDLGRSCGPVLSFAFEEAAARRGALRVVHVWNVHQRYGYGAPALDAAAARELHAEQQQALTALLDPWRARHPGVDVTADVVDGPVAGRLVEAAHGAHLLVVGRRSRHAAAATHIGPVTHGVVHHAATPVAVVPHT